MEQRTGLENQKIWNDDVKDDPKIWSKDAGRRFEIWKEDLKKFLDYNEAFDDEEQNNKQQYARTASILASMPSNLASMPSTFSPMAFTSATMA